MSTTYRPNPSADLTGSDVRRFAKMYGLEIGTHAPGDGVRRYQFIDGHGSNKRILYTALGVREAEVWLRGFMAGADRAIEARNQNPPRIVYRVGQGRKGALVKVYWDSDLREYEVRHERQQEGEGYFTTDKEDAIATADAIAEGQE